MTTPPLMDHQREALPALLAGHTFLAFEPGLGKSRTCIEALDQAKVTGPVLVVCPAIARENWANEFRKWQRIQRSIQIGKPGDTLKACVFIISYDSLSLMKPTVRNDLISYAWDTIILDEAHRLKERRSKRTKYVYGNHCSMQKALASKARRVWLLSGTPAPNHVGELWTHLKALNPKAIATLDGTPMRPEQFEDVYCKVRTGYFGRQIVGSKNVKHLRDQMGRFFIPKREKDCLDLPPLRWDTFALPTDNLKDKDVLQKLDNVLQPYAMAADPVDALKGAGAHLAVERRLLGTLKAPLVAQMVDEELRSASPKTKIIVFAQHTDVISTIMDYLAAYSPVHIAGAVTDKQRNLNIQKFQTDPRCRVLVGQIQAAGEAINLTAANRVIFAETSWVPKDNFQAVKRAHRIGQTDHVRATYAVLANSMDERIIRAVARKTLDLAPVMA